MNIRWLWGNFIDPEWKLTHAQVRQVHRLAKDKYMTQRRMILYTLVVLLVAYVAYGVLHKLVMNWLSNLGYLQAWLISAAVVLVPIMIGGIWSYKFLYRHPVRRAMRELGYDVCINCGYWLRGLDHEVQRCPECGAVREDTPEQSP